MAGLVPAIHEFSQRKVANCRGLVEAPGRQGYIWPGSGPETVFRHDRVDGRDEPGHDADSGAQALVLPTVGIMNIFADFQSRIASLLEKRIAAGELPRDLDLGRFVVEPPRESTHGDLSTNAAMVYAREAKQAGSNPRALAEGLVADLKLEPDVQSADAAGPGFINIVLKPEVYETVLKTVLIHGQRYGAGRRVREGPSTSNM